MIMQRISHLLLKLAIRSLILVNKIGTTEVADVPFLLASCIHRMLAWYKLDGVNLEAKFCDAVDRFGFSSPQALEVEQRIDTLEAALLLGREINGAQECWFRRAIRRGLPIYVARCFCVNKLVKRSGEFKFSEVFEYGAAVLYGLIVSAGFGLIFIELAPVLDAWDTVNPSQKTLLMFLLAGLALMTVVLGYFMALPAYYYQRYARFFNSLIL